MTLTCNFTSSYPPVQMMQWYKYDSDITTGLTGKYIGGNLQNPSLTITDFQPDDQGIYKCSASNLYGTRNSSDIVVYLHVDGGTCTSLKILKSITTVQKNSMRVLHNILYIDVMDFFLNCSTPKVVCIYIRIFKILKF